MLRPVSERSCRWGAAIALVLLSATPSNPARADDVRVHAMAGGAHAVGDPQGSEYGFGGGGGLTGELPLSKLLGVQLELSALGLSSGSAPANPAFAPRAAGAAAMQMLGLRLHPLGAKEVAGLWVDLDGGIVETGADVRGGLDAHVGYDWRIGRRGRWDIGPVVGYTHVFQASDQLRPEDANILFFGVQLSRGARGDHDRDEIFDDEDACPDEPGIRTNDPATNGCPRRDRDHDTVWDDEDACPDEPGIRTQDPKTNGCPRRDRDHDTVFDDEDACPDVAGFRTQDPKTNGCPRGDRDKDTVFDDEDACPDEPGIRTQDPKSNGCPRRDRDKDTVFDDEDACPDVPGIRTQDPKTNGCPKAGDQVRLVGDKIVLGDIIHFDNDSPRVRHQSQPIVEKIAKFLIANPDITEIDIEGHADARGTPEHNLVLSRDRAASVKRLLLQFGVAAGRITTHAYGDARPKVAGVAEEARGQNRRVEFTVTRTRGGGVLVPPGGGTP